jgi:hypothetical protein
MLRISKANFNLKFAIFSKNKDDYTRHMCC